MTRWLRDFRLLPYVLVAIGCLFALKTFSLFSDGSYTLGQRLGNGNNTLVVTTEPAHALCTPNCCPWNAVHGMSSAWSSPDANESVVSVAGRPAPQYCSIQHCEPVLRH